MTKTTILLDADFTVYSIASACQVKIRWDDDIITQHIDMETAKNVLRANLEDTIAAVTDGTSDSADLLLCFSCPSRSYFRHDIEPSYKGNRKGTPSPLGLADLRAWACENYEFRIKDNLEADDVLGIMGSDPRILSGRVVIASVDKDLTQITGEHLNPNAMSDGVYFVGPEQADRQFYMQCLTGDSTDGYPGCPGIGDVKAKRILDAVPAGTNPWPHIVAAYLKAGLTYEDALKQARLARILRSADYDHKNKVPILWTPSASSTSQPAPKARKTR